MAFYSIIQIVSKFKLEHLFISYNVIFVEINWTKQDDGCCLCSYSDIGIP